MSLQRLSERVVGKSRPPESRWKVVPQSRTGGRETPITEFVMCVSIDSAQGCSGAGTRGTASPTFFDRGGRVPHSPLFWTEIRAKVSHSPVVTGYLLKRSVRKFQNNRHSNTSSCIAEQDQRSAVAIFLTCMSVRVCTVYA